jgi:hypothetical protein
MEIHQGAQDDFGHFIKVATSARLSEVDRLEAVSQLVHSAGWQTLSAFAPDANPRKSFASSLTES